MNRRGPGRPRNALRQNVGARDATIALAAELLLGEGYPPSRVYNALAAHGWAGVATSRGIALIHQRVVGIRSAARKWTPRTPLQRSRFHAAAVASLRKRRAELWVDLLADLGGNWRAGYRFMAAELRRRELPWPWKEVPLEALRLAVDVAELAFMSLAVRGQSRGGSPPRRLGPGARVLAGIRTTLLTDLPRREVRLLSKTRK